MIETCKRENHPQITQIAQILTWNCWGRTFSQKDIGENLRNLWMAFSSFTSLIPKRSNFNTSLRAATLGGNLAGPLDCFV
jgi:hypothetical protein